MGLVGRLVGEKDSTEEEKKIVKEKQKKATTKTDQIEKTPKPKTEVREELKKDWLRLYYGGKESELTFQGNKLDPEQIVGLYYTFFDEYGLIIFIF